jgi:hypothetical protein
MVRLQILTLLLLLASPAMAAGGVPRFDVQKTCTNEAKQDPVDQYPVQACVSQEAQARAKIEKQWASFAPNSRSLCVQETNIGGDPSYIEVLTCLEMYQDAASPQPTAPRGGQTTTGRPNKQTTPQDLSLDPGPATR